MDLMWGKEKGRNFPKFVPQALVDDGAIYFDQESEKEQVYDEKPFSCSRAYLNSQKHI